jgi:hypothetical protein
MRQMPHGQWVAFENNRPHSHSAPPASLYTSATSSRRTTSSPRGSALDGINFEEVNVDGIGGLGPAKYTTTRPTAATSQSTQRSLIPYAVATVVIALVIGLWPDGYWFCANSGPAQPHHTGSTTTRGDHACSHFEVWLSGNPARPPGR